MRFIRTLRVVLVLGSAILSSPSIYGQATLGSVAGSVLDSWGAAMPDAR